MKFTLSWLKEYLDTNASLNEISEVLTSIGLEVEEIEDRAEILEPFTVAGILEAERHPDADKLQICKVDAGNGEILSIVCGAPNARAGIKIPLARVGTVIPTNGMKIKQSKIRGVASSGMLCSAAELGISEDAEGILELPENAELGQPFASFIGADDCFIEIAITPNRGDCLGVYGIARDLAAAGLGELKTLAEPVKPQNFVESKVKFSIQESDKCNWFAGVYFSGLENKESPDWLKNKLTSIGKTPIYALVDITNYLTFAFGRPAHIYDADKLSGDLVVRNASKGEKIIALDEKEYELSEDILVIADDKAPQAIAGVIGGLDSGASFDTKNAFLEIAHFDADEVAKIGRKLQIDSDARYRFERVVDYKSYSFASVAVALILDICGGEASSVEISGDIDFSETEIEFEYSAINNRIGFDLSADRIDSILSCLGFEKLSGDDNSAKVKVPSYRPDVTIVEDLSEEVARINGYDDIPLKRLPKPDVIRPIVKPEQKRISKIRRILAISGLDEVVSFSFMNPSKAVKYLPEGNSLIEVANPISSDLGVMRPSLIPNLLDAVNKNKSRGIHNLGFFEVGNSFINIDDEFSQTANVTGVRVGDVKSKSAIEDAEASGVYDVRADVDAILSLNLDIEKIQVTENNDFSYYHPGRSGVCRLGKNIIAVFGELHPSISKLHDIKERVYAFEIFTDNLPKEKVKNSFTRKAFQVSNFQAVDRDFAFLVDDSVTAQSILSAVRKAEKNILDEVSIFDVYAGKNIEEGKKSVALKVKLQPKNDTLTDEEIEKISDAIIASVEKSVGAVLRAS